MTPCVFSADTYLVDEVSHNRRSFPTADHYTTEEPVRAGLGIEPWADSRFSGIPEEGPGGKGTRLCDGISTFSLWGHIILVFLTKFS